MGGVGGSDIQPSVVLPESVSKQALRSTEKGMLGPGNCWVVTGVQLDPATH